MIQDSIGCWVHLYLIFRIGKNIELREGNFSKLKKSKMVISKQTHEGILITSHALTQYVRFLLSEGIEYVLTERFCQDPVEEYFGNQIMIGRDSDSSDFLQCLYNGNTIRVQKEVSLRTVNTRGKYSHKCIWENVYKKIFSLRFVNFYGHLYFRIYIV